MNLAPKPTPREKEKPLSAGGRARLVFLIGLFGLFAVLGTCSPRQSIMSEVRALGVLRVATVNSPTSYYIGQNGEATGFAYDLAKAFADRLGVKLALVVAANTPEAVEKIGRPTVCTPVTTAHLVCPLLLEK